MADSFGIPSEFIDGLETRWETTLDAYNSSDHELLWFFTPSTTATPTDFAIASSMTGRGWGTAITLSSQATNWSYEAKIRTRETHGVTSVTTGSFSLLVVLSELEAQVRAIREALVAIGQGEKVQSYSIRGRSLSQYGLGELTDLYGLLKSELNAEKKSQRHDHGFYHGNFGGAMVHWQGNGTLHGWR